MNLDTILAGTFTSPMPIGSGYTGEVGFVNISGENYVYKRAPFVNGEMNSEMQREILIMTMIADPLLNSRDLINAPKILDARNIRYNNIDYTFIIMTPVRNIRRMSSLNHATFLMLLDDVFEQLSYLYSIGITAHNDLHLKNVLVSIPDPINGYPADNFRFALTGLKAYVIDFGRASVRQDDLHTNPSTDIVSFIMSYMLYRTGYIYNSEYSMIEDEFRQEMSPLYRNGELIEITHRVFARLCENILVNAIGVPRENIPSLYQALRSAGTMMSVRRSRGTVDTSTVLKIPYTYPPYIFLRGYHYHYIQDKVLFNSQESLDNCRREIQLANSGRY